MVSHVVITPSLNRSLAALGTPVCVEAQPHRFLSCTWSITEVVTLAGLVSLEHAVRPLGDAERTEELAQSLGQPYVHLGMNMPAVALPDASPTTPEDVIIWFGVIDILQARASASAGHRKLKVFCAPDGVLLT